MQETYIAEIKKQRQRLRNDMSEATFKTWCAHTLSVLSCIPRLEHFQQRLSEIPTDNIMLENKVGEARRVLTSAVQFIESRVFATSRTLPASLPQAGGILFMPHISQVQSLTQPISIGLDTLLGRVDEDAGVLPENKEEAKSLVRKMWELLTIHDRDITKITDLAIRLAQLGASVQQILSGL